MALRNARLGLWLFVVYASCYAAFVLVNALAPDWMETRLIAGVNAAILSGFGLIGLALVLALVYGVLCSAPGDATGETAGEGER